MSGFVPPPYPYDRLDGLKAKAALHEGGVVDLSIGTPCDPPPPAVVEALAASNAERGYPPSIGTVAYREACAGWVHRRFGIDLDPKANLAAVVGTKEFVATLPQYLRLRDPDRYTVLYPTPAYPTYEMGAILAHCMAVPVPRDAAGRLDFSGIHEAYLEQSLVIWANSPGNPAGQLDDLAALVEIGRRYGTPVVSDECYVEFTWDGPARTVLESRVDGVLALHSLSKRSNAAGLRSGFYAGDPDLVHYLSETRKHVGLLPPGPVQAAAAVAWADDEHVAVQREVYRARLERLRAVLSKAYGIDVPMPQGAFYLWVEAPGGDAWAFADRLATDAGMLVSPGEFYGPAGAHHIRIAAVQPDDKLDLVEHRLSTLE